MAEARLYVLAQFDSGTNEALAKIYDKLLNAGLTGEQTKGIPYHFTLGSFELSETAQILERAKAVAARTKAFPIGLNHIGLFGQKVLFLTPAMNNQLLSLCRSVDPAATLDGVHNWIAHATLLIDSPEHIRTAVPIVAENFSPMTAVVHSLGVYEFFPKKLIAEFPLQK